MGKIYRLGTRTSPLALKQTQEVITRLKELYPNIEVEVVGIDTYGDKDKITPISKIEGTDFFTLEIDKALLAGDIDFSVHSAKDLSGVLETGLCIAAVTESVDSYDVLVSKDNLKLNELKPSAKIGTSSIRRKEQLKKYRGDFEIIDIRGNIDQRLRLLDGTDLDAIVIASAGLIRLGLEDRISQKIPFDILKPHPLQGSLVIETRETDDEVINLLSGLDARQKVLL